MRIEDELGTLEPFRRALPFAEKQMFDELLNGVRQRRTAGGMLPAHEVCKTMVLSMMIELTSQNMRLQQRVERLEATRMETDDRNNS